jgi:flagellar assembly protein FliH
MSAPHKFLFDRSFDLPDAPRNAPRKPPPPVAEPTFSKAELDAAREAGVAAGRAAALAEAAQSNETRVAGSLSSIALGLKVILAARGRYAEDAQRSALETLRAVLAKALPALCRKAPLAEIEAMVAECLREAFDEPRIVLRVTDSLFEAMQPRLEAVVAASGFAGRIVLLADETLGPGDARVEWADGGAERDTRRLTREIDEALARALASIPVPGTSPPEENGNE